MLSMNAKPVLQIRDNAPAGGLGRLACSITNLDDGTVEVVFHGIVGDDLEGMDSPSIISALGKAKGRPINVRINSPGGLAFDGIAIYNALVQHDAPVTTTIESLAGSAASIVAMAGDTVRIAENARFFAHRAEGIQIGNSADHTEYAAFLKEVDMQIATTYAARSGRSVDDMYAMMVGPKGKGTGFMGQELLDAGLADALIPAKRPRGTTANSEDAASVAATHESPEAVSQEAIEQHRKRSVAARLRLMQFDNEAARQAAGITKDPRTVEDIVNNLDAATAALSGAIDVITGEKA